MSTWYPWGMPGVDGNVELARPAPRLSAQTRRTPPRKPAKASAPGAAVEEGEAASNRGKASLCRHRQQPQPAGICKDSRMNLVVSFIFSQIAYYDTHLLVFPAPGGGGEGEGTIPTVGPPGPAPP